MTNQSPDADELRRQKVRRNAAIGGVCFLLFVVIVIVGVEQETKQREQREQQEQVAADADRTRRREMTAAFEGVYDTTEVPDLDALRQADLESRSSSDAKSFFDGEQRGKLTKPVGKVVLINANLRPPQLDELQFELTPELQATTPAEVQTICWIYTLPYRFESQNVSKIYTIAVLVMDQSSKEFIGYNELTWGVGTDGSIVTTDRSHKSPVNPLTTWLGR